MAAVVRTLRGGACALAFSAFPIFSFACSASSNTSEAPPEGDGASTSYAGNSGSSGASSSGGTEAGGAAGSSGGGQAGIVFMSTGGLPSGGSAGAGAAGGVGGDTCNPAPDTPVKEVCGNGLDENLNGFVDENCSCTGGTTQECFNGPPSQANAPNCHKGTQTCSGPSEFQAWGPCENSGCDQVTRQVVCDNEIDDNCDGRNDEGCSFDLTVTIDGDCIGIPCPPQAPNPIGCDITMQGNDSRGCVAHAPGNPAVYFQEGNACPIFGIGDAGHVSGTLKCSTSPDPVVLGPDNCKINKPDPTYTDSPAGCPH
jgi:hypothetical protein